MSSEQPEIVEDLLKGDSINYPTLLLWHLNRISFMNANQTFNELVYARSVRTLHNLLRPYFDDEYNTNLEDSKKEFETHMQEVKSKWDAGELEGRVTSRKLLENQAARERLDTWFGLLVELMGRKNLLLEEASEAKI